MRQVRVTVGAALAKELVQAQFGQGGDSHLVSKVSMDT